ncbi:MAG: S-layer homology domain-containing protein [Peptoniphilus harei]|nr:S-layer homology domain-containing protein [Peptoniphilus harei]
MKPYSKKYLTLALAGVLAASMPVSAFAHEVTPTQPTTPKATEQPADSTKPADQTTPSTPTETEAEKKAKEAEDKAKEEEAKRKKAEADAKKAQEELDKLKKEKEEKEKKEKEENRRKYEKLSLRNVRYDGTYIKGETSADAKIYLKDSERRSSRSEKYLGRAEDDGTFSFKYDIKEGKSVTIYAENEYGYSKDVEVKNDNYKDIKGSKIDASDLRLMGRILTGYIKNHPFENVRVYRDGKLLGSFRTDKNSYFSADLSESISERDLANLRFYIDSKSVENKKFKITEAIEGQKLVKGTSNPKDTITVFDASNRKLGSIDVNNSGVFTVFLDRELIAGETIKIEAKDEAGNLTKLEYKVTKKVVEEAKAISYIKGYPDGTFKPQANVTRAEAAQMFATLLNCGSDFGTSSATKFSDASDDWFSKAINYVVAKGLISGYPDGKFKPNDSITRAEFAQMISGYVNNEKKSAADFKDVKDHWAKDAIDKLYGNKNVNGYPDGTFKPNAKITRAEAVTILNSVFNRNTTSTSLNNVNKSALNKFSDVNEGFWAYYNILDAANTHNRERLNSSSDVDMWK